MTNLPFLGEGNRNLELWLKHIKPEPWVYVGDPGAPQFLNAWVNFGGTEPRARFCRALGFTLLSGVIKGGTSGIRAFDLPPGFRPDPVYGETTTGRGPRFPVLASGGFAVVDVYANVPAAPANAGAVVPVNVVGVTPTSCFLDVVWFRHEET